MTYQVQRELAGALQFRCEVVRDMVLLSRVDVPKTMEPAKEADDAERHDEIRCRHAVLLGC